MRYRITLIAALLLGGLSLGAGPCVTLGQGQQDALKSFALELVKGGVNYYDARQAQKVSQAEYDSAKETLVQAAGAGAFAAWLDIKQGKTREEALKDGKEVARIWAAARGHNLEACLATVQKGAPPDVKAGDILEAVLRQQLEDLARGALAEADAPPGADALPNADPDMVKEKPIPNADPQGVSVQPLYSP